MDQYPDEPGIAGLISVQFFDQLICWLNQRTFLLYDCICRDSTIYNTVMMTIIVIH